MPGPLNDYETLSAISGALEKEYATDGPDPWEGSPFAWILTRPSRTRGAIGERIVARMCTQAGLDVRRPGTSEADLRIAGSMVEVKTSTLWTAGMYRFSQIRDQRYDFALFLGLSPGAVHMWLAPKPVLAEHVIGHLGQHAGAGSRETAWFGFEPTTPPLWLAPYGPTLERVTSILRAAQR